MFYGSKPSPLHEVRRVSCLYALEMSKECDFPLTANWGAFVRFTQVGPVVVFVFTDGSTMAREKPLNKTNTNFIMNT